MNLKNEKRRRKTIRYFLTARSKKKRNCSSLFLSRRQNNVTLFKISLTEQKHALIKKGKNNHNQPPIQKQIRIGCASHFLKIIFYL